jgi:6-pyruvoyltetrahydropterin/6-carboxytetrahydropterin synthase
MNMKATVSRQIHFNAAHRLYNKNWSDLKNQEVFGKCNNPNYHGHNYTVEARIRGEIDPETGYVVDTKIIKELLEKEVVELFDHRNLNLDTEEFRDLNPTAENIARVIFEKINTKIGTNKELTIVLHETERNYVEFNGQ